ncbi:MAG TPA: hypothetical protein VF765_26055 [Polyangiaceae bacterium]
MGVSSPRFVAVVGISAMAFACTSGPPTGWGTGFGGSAAGDDGGTETDATPRTSGPPSASGSSSGSGGSGSSSGGGGAIPGPTSPEGGGVAEAGPPPGCTYPSGPYGITTGAVLHPMLSWQGYAPGASSASTVTARDYFDCDGTKGINALYIDVSTMDCPACQNEAQDLPGQMSGAWGQDGVKVLTLLVGNASGNPPALPDAQTWISTFGLGAIAVCIDPYNTFYTPDLTAVPDGILVNPRTMTIVSVSQGYGGPDPAVDALAQKNK